jgi:hypothetical protein
MVAACSCVYVHAFSCMHAPMLGTLVCKVVISICGDGVVANCRQGGRQGGRQTGREAGRQAGRLAY